MFLEAFSGMTITNVTKKYGEKTVLDGVSFTFPTGKISALMGPSGCGKSTLVRLILGIEAPDSGSILRDGDTFAAVFQEDRLSEPLSACRNVLLGREDATAEEAEALLRGLGLDADKRKPVSALSGGMRRRVAIARALIAKADTVLFDEPFSALDEDTKRDVLAFARAHLVGKTVLLVTHDIAEARAFADEIFAFPAK